MKYKILLAAIVVIASAFSSYSSPGDLDPTFSGDGLLPTTFFHPNGAEFDMIRIQPNGKLITTTRVQSGNGFYTSVLRYNIDGSPDLTFGIGGATDLWYMDDTKIISTKMELQADGKVVLTYKKQFNDLDGCGAVRVLADGGIDTAFGVDGRAKITFPGISCSSVDLKVQPDGKILVLGTAKPGTSGNSSLWDYALLRFNANGTPDTTFDGDGYLQKNVDLRDEPTALLLRPDGKIVVVGSSLIMAAETIEQTILRFNANGTPDNNFGNSGVVIFGDPQDQNFNYDAVLQADGKIVLIGGPTAVLNEIGLALMRRNEDGSGDTSFGTNGSVFTPQEANGTRGAIALAIQPDGKILAAGAALSSAPNFTDMAVMRYNADGSLDAPPAFARMGKHESILTSFWGTNGLARANFAPNKFCVAGDLQIDAAGRVIVAGIGPDAILGLARFQGNNPPYAGISGTVRTAGGMPIRNAFVTVSGGSLSAPIMAQTGNLGVYNITGLPVTETYTVFTSAKRFRFPDGGERTVTLNADAANIDFSANP